MIPQSFEIFDYVHDKVHSKFEGYLCGQKYIQIKTPDGHWIASFGAKIVKLLFNQGYEIIYESREDLTRYSDYGKPELRIEWSENFNKLKDAKRELKSFIENETKKYIGGAK